MTEGSTSIMGVTVRAKGAVGGSASVVADGGLVCMPGALFFNPVVPPALPLMLLPEEVRGAGAGELTIGGGVRGA